ncbi:MAG: phosphoribosylanthranilate isomerase [Armatimonadota bacterium]|nr:phosphoribosylanthranilate isomerase [Armatimonadota bacterium]MDR7484737.1 phosphoribosylanthranilate isomerase [Armatimonadota bacterium]MDR7531852.1 phosphoribosylanthranilate isomerase [Armatimonadota bacterium]MDR7534803.1 phosphoribosylanthranilate isomerase [Armatimonadota bacterium]
MIRVKICGITDDAEALAAAAAGADAVGFVFAPSRRQIDPVRARQVAAVLPPFVTRVGVVVNEPLERLRALVDGVRLDAVQLHGDEPPEYCAAAAAWGITVIKAVPVAGPLDLARLRAYRAAAVLLDAHRPGQRGGTGQPFDWRLAAPTAQVLRVILSGGLRPETVAEGIRVVRPYGVDVSSGVESDGRKDPAKMAAFVAAARQAASSPGTPAASGREVCRHHEAADAVR